MNLKKFLRDMKDADERGVNYFEESINKVKSSNQKENKSSSSKLRELTKSELDEIKALDKKDKENTTKYEEFKNYKTVDGKKITPKKYNEVSNEFMNKGQSLRKQISDIERKPRDEYNIQKIKDAYKRKEFDKKTRDNMIDSVKYGGTDELDLYYKNKGLPTEFDYEKAQKEYMDKQSGINIKPVKEKKTYKERNIMKARSDLKKVGDKYHVDTDLKVRKGLEPKIKRALKKSVINTLDNEIAGSGIRKINLDYSSSEEDKPRRKKGKGLYGDSESDSDSDSDEEDIKDLGKMLSHLISHIKDPKEKIDPKDYKQSIELIKKIKAKKR